MRSGVRRILDPGQSVAQSFKYGKLGADAIPTGLLDINAWLVMAIGSEPILHQKQIRCVTHII